MDMWEKAWLRGGGKRHGCVGRSMAEGKQPMGPKMGWRGKGVDRRLQAGS